MADWGVPELMLRQIDLRLAGANWQRGGGKGQRPKPIPLPDDKGRGDRPTVVKPSAADVTERLRNLGMIPSGADSEPPSLAG